MSMDKPMTVDDMIDMATKLRHILDAADCAPLERKSILVFLAANYILTTGEILFGDDRAKIMELINNFATNMRVVVKAGIDSGGITIDDVDAPKTKQ